MKTFGTLLCLATIAISTALGSSAMLFCKHETGNGHLVSKAAHATEKHGQWCTSSEHAGSQKSASSCDSCTDTQVESPNSLEDIAPASERSPVKTPLIAEFVFAAALLEIPSARSAQSSKPARAPPASTPSARDFYTETVQLLL